MAEGEIADEVVEIGGRQSRPDEIGQLIEALGDQRARLAHAGEGARPMQLDLPGFAHGGI